MWGERDTMSTKTFNNLIEGWNNRIIMLLDNLNISQTTLSNELGRTPATVSQYFRRDKPSLPPLDVFAKICMLLRISSDYILFGKNPINPKIIQLTKLIDELKSSLDREGGLESEQLKSISQAVNDRPELLRLIEVITESKDGDSVETIAGIIKQKLDKKTINKLTIQLIQEDEM